MRKPLINDAATETLSEEKDVQCSTPHNIFLEDSSNYCIHFIKSIPVFFGILLIALIYIVYVGLHGSNHFQVVIDGKRHFHFSPRYIIEFLLFHLFFFLFLTSYTLVMITSPGTIPSFGGWTDFATIQHLISEKKNQGAARYCKWCQKYKPDRTHHCRQCRVCVLKMDHHCVWIQNCVGWGNHKYFCLTLLYGAITCLFVAVAQFNSVMEVYKSVDSYMEVMIVFVVTEVICFLLGLVLALFFCFHFFLLIKNMTSVEFCEKHFRQYNSTFNIYDNSWRENIKDALGPSLFLSVLPIDNRKGNGISFRMNREFPVPSPSCSDNQSTDRLQEEDTNKLVESQEHNNGE